MHAHAHSSRPHDVDWDAMVASAELEADVLMPFLDEVISTLAGIARRDGLDVHRILDVGSGPGVATCRLAEWFGDATVVAADGSVEMLANVAARASRLGVKGEGEDPAHRAPRRGGGPGLGRPGVGFHGAPPRG